MSLRVEQVVKRFGKEEVLHQLSFELAPYEVLSILGRSGSGKTTLLKIIAGLETEDEGSIYWNDQLMNPVPANKRGIVYLYQEALLFPHLNIFENVAFGLRIRKLPEAEVRLKVSAMLDRLGISDQAEKRPEQLSGGQKQRVAFGRALVINPRVLLLDEPFGALDTETRSQMQDLLIRVLKEGQTTAVFVTHDLKEALLVGDRLGKIERGSLHLYPNKEAFIQDPATGVQGELDFWKSIRASSKKKS
jgi:ABC-type Fe3+/spermidine/putrescine transport system ATPase subunit